MHKDAIKRRYSTIPSCWVVIRFFSAKNTRFRLFLNLDAAKFKGHYSHYPAHSIFVMISSSSAVSRCASSFNIFHSPKKPVVERSIMV